MTLKPTESKHLLRPDQCVNVLWTWPKLYLYHTRWRKLNEHQRKMIWAQHHMRDKRNYSILTIRIDKVSFLLSWSANIHTLWIQWCLRMINQLMWHLSWNPSGLLTDSIFEMQLPSLTRVLSGPGFLAQVIYRIKSKCTQDGKFIPSHVKCKVFKDSCVPTVRVSRWSVWQATSLERSCWM